MRTGTITMAAALLAVFTGAGCGVGSAGALDQVGFAADCDESDADCWALGLDAPLAVGGEATLDLAVTSPGSATPTLTLAAARPELLEVEGRRIAGRAPGLTALVVSDEARQAIDFIHLSVAVPDELALVAFDPIAPGALGDRMQMIVGDDLSVMPTLMLNDQRLLGTGPVEVAVEGSAVSVLDEGLGARRRLVAREPGSAEIAITMLDVTTSITVEVLP